MRHLLNDSAKPVSENMLNATRNYDVHPVLWFARDNASDELAA